MNQKLEQKQKNAISFELTDTQFAAQFSINATPDRLSQLQIDLPILTADKIKDGSNIHTFVDEDGNVIISAEVDAHIDWSEVDNKPTINGKPLIGDVTIENNADWYDIENKPDFARVARTGEYKGFKKINLIFLKKYLNYRTTKIIQQHKI